MWNVKFDHALSFYMLRKVFSHYFSKKKLGLSKAVGVFALCVCAVLQHSFSHFFCQTTLIDHGFFIFHFFFFPQAVRAFLSGQLDEIWHTSVEGVVIALLTNIIEINVNTVDWKNASRWAWDVRVNFILKLYFSSLLT